MPEFLTQAHQTLFAQNWLNFEKGVKKHHSGRFIDRFPYFPYERLFLGFFKRGLFSFSQNNFSQIFIFIETSYSKRIQRTHIIKCLHPTTINICTTI